MELNVSAAQAALANPAAHAGLKDLLAHSPADAQAALAGVSAGSPSVSTVGLAGHIVTKETVGVPGERLQIVDEDKQFTCVWALGVLIESSPGRWRWRRVQLELRADPRVMHRWTSQQEPQLVARQVGADRQGLRLRCRRRLWLAVDRQEWVSLA